MDNKDRSILEKINSEMKNKKNSDMTLVIVVLKLGLCFGAIALILAKI